MPYIDQESRYGIDHGEYPGTAGEFNYLITTMAHAYWVNNGKNYQAFNDILGALEGCKLELYRRKVAPYEDGKIEENGDV